MRQRTRDLLARLHLSLAPDAPMERLSAAQAQLVQVARALAFDCRVLVLDEPTTALTSAEADHLFRVLDDLRERGVTILYVSHRIPEVFRLCDRMTVLRDGAYVETFVHSRGSSSSSAATPDRIIRAMVGRDLPTREKRTVDRRRRGAAAARRQPAAGRARREPGGRTAARSSACSASSARAARSCSRQSSGCIRADARGSLRRRRAGRRRQRPSTPRAPASRSFPRTGSGRRFFFNLALRHNLVLPRATTTGAMVMHAVEERAFSSGLLRSWNIKAPGIDATPDRLSGGNQQKVVLARWLAINPRVFLLDEPTKGVDVGAKDEIHEIIRKKASDGAACLVVSSDLPGDPRARASHRRDARGTRSRASSALPRRTRNR